MTTRHAGPQLRLLTLDDAPDLAALVGRNRDYLAPWEPDRDAGYFTTEGQRAVLESALSRHQQGGELPLAILAEDGRIIGRVTLTTIVWGPFQSCKSATG